MLLHKLLWRIIIMSGVFLIIEAATLQCYRKSINDYDVATLDNPETLLNSSCINENRSTVVYTFGYTGTEDGVSTITILTAYLNKNKYNVILLNWQEEASTKSLFGFDPSYVFSALPNAILIGVQLGQALVKLSNFGVDLSSTELVGHSLGAHLCGYAGREVNINGKAVGTIIGLDPAGPFFDRYFPLLPPLDRTCAKFVYSIHTDPGNYGMNSSTATVDIWPNFGNFINGSDLQPGCSVGNFSQFSDEDLCNHGRSWQLHNESMSIPNYLQASKADNYSSWVTANGDSPHILYLDRVDRESLSDYDVATLDKPESLSNSSCISRNKSTVVYVFGYRGMVDGDASTTVLTGYIDTNKYNVILLNWQKEASSKTLYGAKASYLLSAIPNAISIGKQLGQALVKLSTSVIDLNTTECVGHSLGAHLCGYAGRQVNSNGKSIETIIGLDPAGPFYDRDIPRQTPLDSTCANFVYSIHTDPGNYGMNSSTATVDIWPNFGNFIDGNDLQPNCPNGTYPEFSTEDLCNHNLSWKLHNASLSIPNILQASKADNYSTWVAADGDSSNIIYLDAVDREAKGNFYLTTNGNYPYGKGEAGLKP